jgi:hypothetical protein
MADQPTSMPERRGLRLTIAMGALVALLAVLAIAISSGVARDVLSLVLPVFATLAGAALAFAHEKGTVRAAHEQTLAALDKAGGAAAAPVARVMIPRAQIVFASVPPGAALKDVKLADIDRLMQAPSTAEDGRVSRVPILTQDSVLAGLIHRAAWAELKFENVPRAFTLSQTQSQSLGVIAQQSEAQTETVTLPAVKFDSDSLERLLDMPCQSPFGTTFGDIFTRSVGFVPEDATLAVAKWAMAAKPGCEDVMVTRTGKADEPVLGWITDIDLARAAPA